MDATGYAYLVLAVFLFAGVLTAIHFLTRGAPRLTMLVVGAVLFFGTMAASGSLRTTRLGLLVTGVLSLSGFVTMIIGIFRLFRRERKHPSGTPAAQGDDGHGKADL
jgi:hypothetical protein